ncbi:hypothetical protein GCM10007858_38340 [Bradyrhizobium liaoningense]|nr:hypothetical protein GCM10007858_38340 [Bradyrhizobium liaoningense]
MKPAESVLLPTLFVTTTSTAPAACAGTTAVICVPLLTVKEVAALLPNATAVAKVNPVPVMTTDVPPSAAPVFGLTEATVGAGALTQRLATLSAG